MISAFLYKPIYYIIVTLFTIICMYNSSWKSFLHKQKGQDYVALSLLLLLAVFLGFRPNSELYFVDMANYSATYELNIGEKFFFDWSTNNIIFDNVFLFMASKSYPVEWFFFFISFIYFFCIYIVCHKYFKSSTLLAVVVYLGAFSTFSYATNGIKAGVATSIFLLALAFRKNVKLSLFFVLLSCGFHHSMPLVALAYLLTFIIRRPRFFLFLWFICLLLAAFQVTYFLDFFAGFTDEHGADYLTGKYEEVSGFRPDFIMYSAIPIFLGWYLIHNKHVRSRTYYMLWSTYTAANSFWLLCTYASFTNRIAYLSWFMYPLVLIYPFLNAFWSKNQHVYLKYVVYGHLAFTLFMFFIYYR